MKREVQHWALPRDNPIRQAFELSRDRHIGPAYDPRRPEARRQAMRQLFNDAYPGMSRALWDFARRLDSGVPQREAAARIRAYAERKLREANRSS